MIPQVLAGLVAGLAASAHCVFMCGAIASGVACGPGAPSSTKARGRDVLVANFGRVATYTVFGALFGASVLFGERFAPPAAVRSTVNALAALVLVAAAANLLGIVPALAPLERFAAPLWKVVAPHAQRLRSAKSVRGLFAFGLLWGLLPCGAVYAALGLAAASGSVLAGALTMFAFGLGTLPATTVLGGAVSALVASCRTRAYRWVAAAALLGIAVASCLPMATRTGWMEALSGSGAQGHCCPPRRSTE